MLKKRQNFFIRGVAINQILLVIISIISISFISGQAVAVAGTEPVWTWWDRALGRDKAFAAGQKAASPPLNPGETAKPGFFGNLFGDTPFGTSGLGASLLSGLIWGGVAYGVGYLIGSLLGLDENTTSALSTALGVGVFVEDE